MGDQDFFIGHLCHNFVIMLIVELSYLQIIREVGVSKRA